MTYRSKYALVSLAVHLLIFIWQYISITSQISKSLAIETQAYLWAVFFLKAVGMSLIAYLFLAIIVMMIQRFQRKENPDLVSKEARLPLLELSAIRNASLTLSLGFMIAMGLLAFGISVYTMFQALAFTYLLAGIVLFLSTVFYYERGIN